MMFRSGNLQWLSSAVTTNPLIYIFNQLFIDKYKMKKIMVTPPTITQLASISQLF